jgi:hypothetical protein
VLKSDPDLATFLEGLKTASPEQAKKPKRRESVIRGTFALPEVDRANTFRIVLAGTVAVLVFFATLVGFVQFFHQP